MSEMELGNPIPVDYEKKHKEEVVRATQLWECGDITRENLEYIFPELRESEDERIRNQIINFIEEYGNPIHCEWQKDWIAWLEKQGQTFTQKDVDDAYLKGVSDTKHELEKQEEKPQGKTALEAWKDMRLEVYQQASGNRHEPNCSDDSTKMFSLNDIDEIIEKISEQKSDNKVEPKFHKFHKGDWITHNTANFIFKIINVGSNSYEVVNRENHKRTISFDNEDKYNLWTIADAKPGDVLIYKGNVKYSNEIKYERICLFNNFDNAFFTLTKSSNYVEECDVNVNIDYPDNTVPATKEQKEILFMAMKDADYEFDFDKKELKKIEEEYDEDYGIDSLFHAQRILEKTLGKVDGYQSDDGILEHKCAISAVKKLYEQKPAWSEEDENRMKKVMHILSLDGRISNEELKSIYDWLKSLRPQKPTEWSEEDEHEFQVIQKIICDSDTSSTLANRLSNWLKSLKQRMGE